MELWTGSKLGKEYVKAVCEAEYRIKIARRNIHTLRYREDTTFMAESKEKLKSLLMKEKEEKEKAG